MPFCILHVHPSLINMKKIPFVACIVTVSLYFTACKDEYTICNLSREVRFTGGFYRKLGANDVASPAPKFTLSQLNISPAFYNEQVNVQTFSVPLNSLTDSGKYVLKLDNNLQADTVTVTYTSQGVNLSLECGSVTYNTITKITTTINTIDSIKIIKPLVNTEAGVNARIYY